MKPTEDQKQQPTPSPTPAAPTANPHTSTSSAKAAAVDTTSKQSVFRDECIVLVLSPRKTVHPVIDGTTQKVRIFDNAELASVEILGSKILQSHPSAVIPLKDLFS